MKKLRPLGAEFRDLWARANTVTRFNEKRGPIYRLI